MIFLNVFCFVVCLHTSVSTPSQNNARNVLYEQPTKTLNDSSTSTNYWQSHEVADGSPHIIQRITKYPLLKSIDITLESNIEKGRPVRNPARTILTRTLLRDLKHEHTKNLQNEELATRSNYRVSRPEDNVQSAYKSGHLNEINLMYNVQNSPGPEPFGTSVSISRDNVNRNLLRDDIRNNILPNTYKKRENFDSDMNVINDNNYQYQPSMKQRPLGPEEIRLDLQGLSFEDVQSLTGTSILGNPQERQLPSVINLNLDEDNVLKSIPVHIMNKARELHSIHAAAKKLKHYMIVHSDGTVEHTDKLEMVAEKYPNNYITIKSTDLKKYGQTSKAYFPASVSESHSGVSSSNAHFPAKLLTQEKTKQEVLSKTLENKDDDVIKSNAESALSTEKELPLPYNSSESAPKQDLMKNDTFHTHMPHENSVNKDLSIVLKNSTTVRPNTEKSLKDKDNNKDHISPSWIPLNLTEPKIDKSQSSDSLTNPHPPAIPLIQENIKQKVFRRPLKNKDENVIKPNELSALSIKELPLPNNFSETTSMQEITNNLTTHTDMPHGNLINKNLSIVLKNSTTIGPNTETILKDIDKDTDQTNSLSWIPVNVTKDNTDNINITSSLPGSPTPSVEDHSGVWFQDKNFWDNLQKGAQNVVYFFFVPPLPEVRKETKITLYPNGTKVEELTELVDNEGCIPQALKTIKVTHAVEDAKT